MVGTGTLGVLCGCSDGGGLVGWGESVGGFEVECCYKGLVHCQRGSLCGFVYGS